MNTLNLRRLLLPVACLAIAACQSQGVMAPAPPPPSDPALPPQAATAPGGVPSESPTDNTPTPPTTPP